MKVAYLAINPTEHILNEDVLLFEEVNVLKIDKKRHLVTIHSLKWQSIVNWASDYSIAEVGYIWLSQDWAKGAEEIEKMKIRYEKR